MKVLAQNYASGKLEIIEAPLPTPSATDLIVRTVASAVSIGTEKNMINVARKSLLGKAIERPDWVLQVKNKVKTEGVAEAYRQSKARLDLSVPLGYSSAGVVEEVGSGVERFSIGDAVVCSGSGYASHADFNCVPEKFCEKIPDSVSFEDAAFCALGGIALEAIRLAKPALGDRVAVIGLGLIGNLTVKLLKANGCRILGIDIDTEKLAMGKSLGCDAVANSTSDSLSVIVDTLTDGKKFDSVIISAATKSNEPIETAARICRERGKIVVAGLVGLEIPRKEFFEKELGVTVSRAWGPGAISAPEFPHLLRSPYPRWSASENILAFLQLLEGGAISIHELVSKRVQFSQAPEIYTKLIEGQESESGIILSYESGNPVLAKSRSRINHLQERSGPVGGSNRKEQVGIGLIGAGMFSRGTFLPRLQKFADVDLVGVASARGLSAAEVAKKYRFGFATSDYRELLVSQSTNLIAILTRHGTHAQLVMECLEAGKNVFVEKPLAINEAELRKVCKALLDNPESLVQVGFNRRFSPSAIGLKKKFASINEPLALNFQVNAGTLPKESWVYDADEGGGRIVGELCHFVDLAVFFTQSRVVSVDASSIKTDRFRKDDNVFATLQFSNGSVATISYFSDGDKSAPRERVEVVGGGAIGVIHDFQRFSFISGGKKTSSSYFANVDRGAKSILKHIIGAVQGVEAHSNDVPALFNTTATTFAIRVALDLGTRVTVPLLENE